MCLDKASGPRMKRMTGGLMAGQDGGRRDGSPELISDRSTRESLEMLVEGVAVLAGFEQSAISIRRGDEFEVVAVAGPGVAEKILGRRLPVRLVADELERSDEWGPWRFVPHDRVGDEVLEYSHVYREQAGDGPDAWHPLDLLTAPVYDDEGELRGLLSVDVPRDGRRPGPDQLNVLSKYAGVARTSVLLALEREDLATRVRMATEAREIVRRALSERSLDLVLEACRSAVVDCFDAIGMWVTAFDARGGTSTAWYAEGAESEPPFSEIDDVVIRLAHRYWADQYVAPFSRNGPPLPGLPPEDAEGLLHFLDGIGIGSVLFVPLGVGPECLGFLVLTRVSDSRPWTDVECEAALDIGRDLGRAVANARQLEHERALVERLRKLDGYRVELVNTLAHELRNPLFSVTANLEMLDVDGLDEDGRRSVAAAMRGADRMESVIEDLLTMARMADPRNVFVPAAVDLVEVVEDVLEECQPAARAASVACDADVPERPVVVSGRRDELHRLLANLASNAIKYSDPGGRVVLRLVAAGDEVVVVVADEGIGIGEKDQEQLFREFFRTTNPDALERPGTGLGLAIVDRIAKRHGGRIDLESTLGQGTTVTVTLPITADLGEDAAAAV
jgi:signal transduction histidine kinase